MNSFHPALADATLKIRQARHSDWDAVAELLGASPLPLAGARAHLGSFWIAERGGAVVGCVGLERYGAAALLRSVAVNAEARGVGLGRKLVEHVVANARGMGVNTLVLVTTTAQAYFLRFGFRRVDRGEVPHVLLTSNEFRGACPAGSVVMRCDLGAHGPRLIRSASRSREAYAASVLARTEPR